MRDGMVDFLIDTELLTDRANEQASQQWQALKEQFPNQAISIGVPALRIYGLVGKVPLPPAEDPSWSKDEGLQFTDREGKHQSIPKAAFSHLEQLELGVQLRSETEVRRTVLTKDEHAATQGQRLGDRALRWKSATRCWWRRCRLHGLDNSKRCDLPQYSRDLKSPGKVPCPPVPVAIES